MTDVDNALGFALGVMFVNETFDKKTKPEAEKMIKLITKAFRYYQNYTFTGSFYIKFYLPKSSNCWPLVQF